MANNKKQFGVWMDGQDAYVVGKKNVTDGDFVLQGHVKGEKAAANSNENAANNQQKTLEQKFFKEITALMQNAEEVYITGPGKIQEQFKNYLADTPQFKNTNTDIFSSEKMSEEKIVEFFSEKFN